MESPEVSALVARLLRAPRDEEAWLGVARWWRRAPASGVVDELRPLRASLRRLLRQSPRRLELAPAMLAVLDLEALPLDPEALPRGWRIRRRLPVGEPGDPRDPVTGLPLRVRHRPTGIELMLVPGGRARVGKELCGSPIFEAQHVRVRDFYLARHPVTRAELAAYLAAVGAGDAPADPPEAPAGALSHQTAEAFCAWAGGRLPGEYEWEYAGRSHDGRRFPWRKGTAGCPGMPEAFQRRRPEPVDPAVAAGLGVAGASPFGIEDMTGLTADWCREVWGKGDTHATVRGGCIDHPDNLYERATRTITYRSSFRAVYLTARRGVRRDTTSPRLGFRLCLPLVPGEAPVAPGVAPAWNGLPVEQKVGDPRREPA